ncbi:MAG: cation:proton antiporter [Clostridiales bacterium]|nr:cation:proton antiporter [Clostridiales bacterium]
MLIEELQQGTIALLSLSAILLSGFLLTGIAARVKLPRVSAYIIAGILIGPYTLNIIPKNLTENMGFVSDIALAFIAFGASRYFEKDTIKRAGMSIIGITLLESLLAGVLVAASMLVFFHLDARLSLLLGAIATATAPASMVMTIKQYRAQGEFVDQLLQVVALDDIVCLLVFSIVVAAVNAGASGLSLFANAMMPILVNLCMIGVGGLFSLLLDRLIRLHHGNKDSRLIIAIALLLGLSGLCSGLDVSPLLACMAFGAVYINQSQDRELYDQLDVFTPPIMLLFFVVSGMRLDPGVLASFGMAGAVYFVVRIIGKYIGAYAGCFLYKTSKPVRRYLGVALIPQAGVSIGLSFLAQRILKDGIGQVLVTIILASSVLYELIGPLCVKIALMRSGAALDAE